MKACVVGYGAMGRIVCDILKDELYKVIALECVDKDFSNIDNQFDVIIDFSNPGNLDMIIDYAKYNHKPVVFATTGYSDCDLEKIAELSKFVPVLRSANFSLGIVLMNKIISQMTKVLKEDFDIEIVETHHHNKIDAPSGTAKMLLDTIIDETGFVPCYGRSGYSPRKPNEVGVHAVRGGTVVGEHEVIYAGSDEILKISHSALSKKVFAVGAIKAARFLINQENGYYNMNDVIHL